MALYVHESGPKNAPTVLFIHGGGTRGWSWGPQLLAMADSFHCLIPDLPGHGRSFAEGPFSIEDCGRRMADLIKSRAHGGRAHVVGLSLGAQIVVALLGRNPQAVDRAIISAALVKPMPAAWLIHLMVRLWLPFKNNKSLIKWTMNKAGIPDIYLAEMHRDMLEMPPQVLRRVIEENQRFRLPPTLSDAQTPVLVLAGEKEMAAMHASCRELVAALPNAEGRLAPGAHHPWNLEKPELFNKTIMAWLNGYPLPEELLPLDSSR